MKRYWVPLLALLFAFPQVVPAQADFREETIYFLLTTRFFDGDPSNNRPNEWSSFGPNSPNITDPNDVTWRGDFKGLVQKLPYIKDLGFTAIWITPIVLNWSPLDYHGYHAYDFTKVDPRLESPGYTFKDVVDSVHKHGMKLVLDVVTNHAGRYGVKGHAEIKYNSDPTKPWGQDKNGQPLKPNPNWQYDGMTPNPDDGKIWSRANVPPMPAPFNQNLAAYNWPGKESYVDTSDPEWYHHSGNGFAQGYDDLENLYNRALAGDTPDFNTSSAKVRNYLVNAYKTYIEMGVDAFRWDTIKHMSKEDVLYFLDEFKKINPNLFVFGEVAQKRHELHNEEKINPHWYTWRGATGSSENSGMAVLDFFAMSSFHLFEKGENYGGVQAAARYDHLYADPSTNLLFLDNHDFGPNNDWNKRYGGNDENLAAALNFMFTWRGIPILYYGTEMRFKSGAYTDIHNEQGTRESIDNTGRAYYGDAMAAAPNHRMYKHIRKLNAIRKAVPALQKGSWRWAGSNGGNGVGFIREAGDSYAVVGLAKDGSVTHNFSGIRNGTYRDAVTGHEVTVTNGSLTFTAGPSSAGIYVLNGPGRLGDLGAGFFQTSTDGSGGGGGGGGGGGTVTPATITPEPNPPVAGQSVKITYDGTLNSQTTVVMHWGVNGWTQVKDNAMSKNGTKWEATVTVPSGATELNLAFNNGGSTWDSNNGSDYKITVTAGSGGGGGGGVTPTVVTSAPASVVAGQNVTVTYDGVLNTEAQVNMHWGINSWKEVKSSPMSKNGAKWEVTVSVPAAATEMNMAFNNGTGKWDNNNGSDFKFQVTGSGGGGGGTGGSGIVTWSPASPKANETITVTITGTKAAKLHWGVNNWSTPAAVYQPSGSAAADGATQTPFGPLTDGKQTLILGPFNSSAQEVNTINFVIKFNDNTWDNNNNQNWNISVSKATSNEDDTRPATASLRQNFPNPFNPSTVIGYELNEAAAVKLTVLAVDGRHVATLVDERKASGTYGAPFNAAGLSSGVYLYRIEVIGESGRVFTQTRKMMLLK
jgi:glycosidase